MSDTCVVRSVKVFIPTLTEKESDLSEGRLCKEQVQPSGMTDQTGVPAMLLIPIRQYSNSWDWLLPAQLAWFTYSLIKIHEKNISPQTVEFRNRAFHLVSFTSLVFSSTPTCNLNNGLCWGRGGNLFLIISYIPSAAHRFTRQYHMKFG